MNIKKLFWALPALLLVLMVTGCFEKRESLFEGQYLEWAPTDRNTNQITSFFNFDHDDLSTTETLTLQMQYAGVHQNHDITGVFEVAGESTAVEGKHFNIIGDRSLTVPANSSLSSTVDVEILSAELNPGDTARLILRITDASDVIPMENYRDYVITISKGHEPPPVTLDPISVTLSHPGSNSNTNRLMDILTGDTFSVNGGSNDTQIQGAIDLGLFRSGSVGLMLISTGDDSPGTSEGIARFGGGRTIRDEWTNKNDGDLMRLPASRGNNEELLNGIDTEEDLLDAFTIAEEWTGEQSADIHPRLIGPNKYLQESVGSEELPFTVGDLIFFKSTTRGVHMVGIVMQVNDGADDASRFITINYKRAVIP